ncbi:MAG: SHOCT domain-containing protein [Erysipelotrichaceae bacterium]|nr:SHOCT domain-containing protein [Erysipelotrichaceae bacterium]
MITALQMDEYCIRNGLGYYPDTSHKKDFAVLEEQIREQEELLMAFTANNLYNADSAIIWSGNIPVVVTDHRLLYGKKALLNSPVRIADINDITDIGESSFGNYETKLMIDFAIGERIMFGLNRKNADKVIDLLKETIEKQKKCEKKETASVADELLKFKQLLDMGAITPEEYEKKKKELLGS